jgi:hypothetical protein
MSFILTSTPLTLSSFIFTYISSNKYLPSTLLENTLITFIEDNSFPFLKPYLEVLRILYFFRRLKKGDNSSLTLARTLESKYYYSSFLKLY